MTTGLLVIDLQRGMFMDAEPHDGAGVLSRTASLLERARRKGVPVLHVRHDGGPGDALARGTPGFRVLASGGFVDPAAANDIAF